jgi:hypothetical protein
MSITLCSHSENPKQLPESVMEYEIRVADISELKLVQNFLDIHWIKNHILSRNDNLMRWQHENTINRKLNYVIAFNTEKNEIDGLIGFIKTSHFDPEIKDNCAWIAIWKIREDVQKPGLGLMLYRYLMSEQKLSAIGGYAISDVAFKIYKLLRFEHGQLEHFFIKNNNVLTFQIADFSKSTSLFENAKVKNRDLHFEDWNQKDFPLHDLVPSKSALFFINRYINHPIYQYKVKSIYRKNSIDAVFSYREIIVQNSKCLRIVDWVGNFPDNASADFQNLLSDENAEYIDFLCHVPNSNDILQMGFHLKKDDEVIIPHYFEPFVKENMTMDYAYLNKTGRPYSLFKADGDQDRPNI